MPLYDDAIARLRDQRGELERDLQLWAERAADPGDLGIHYSQVRRLNRQISTALGAALAHTPVAEHPPDGDRGTVSDLPDLRRTLGTLHLLWDFYRDKLAQRDTAAYTDHLGVADDLAWACYEPFLQAARAAEMVSADEVKEPPLVFYSTDRTPYAQARTKALQPPGIDSIDLEKVTTALLRLPVPVIGVPWSIANKLPELVLVGHEAGHVIAEDLKLKQDLRAMFSELVLSADTGQRKCVWTRWRDEIFADVVGVLASGSAFLHGLAAEMAGPPSDVGQVPIDPDHPGHYPTPALRVALCTAILESVGVTSPRAWSETYGSAAGDSAAFVRDIPVVTDALTGTSGRSWGARR